MLESFATIAAALGLSGIVSWLLSAQQRKRDAERQNGEDDYTWNERWEKCQKEKDELRAEMEARLNEAMEQYRADIAARDAQWQEKCDELQGDVAALARKIARYERSRPDTV